MPDCESFMERYIGVYDYVTYIIGASLKKSEAICNETTFEASMRLLFVV